MHQTWLIPLYIFCFFLIKILYSIIITLRLDKTTLFDKNHLLFSSEYHFQVLDVLNKITHAIISMIHPTLSSIFSVLFLSFVCSRCYEWKSKNLISAIYTITYFRLFTGFSPRIHWLLIYFLLCWLYNQNKNQWIDYHL